MKQARKLLITGCFFFCLYGTYPLLAQTTIIAAGKGFSLEPVKTPKLIAPQEVTVTMPPARVPEIAEKPVTEAAAPAPIDLGRLTINAAETPSAKAVFRKLYNTPKVNEQAKIRAEWAEAFGCDVWYPYYVAKEIEHRVKEKASIRIFKLKGKPEFKKGSFLYVFKTRF